MRFLGALRCRQTTVVARTCSSSLLSARFSSTQPQHSNDVRPSNGGQDPNESHRAVTVKPFSAIPGPRGLPVFGTALEWMRSGKIFKMSEMIQERVERYGTIYREKMFPGLPEQVVIADPQDVATVFGADGQWPLREFGGEILVKTREKGGMSVGLFTSQGKEWHDLRQPIQKFIMVPSRVGQHHSDFNLITEDLMNNINTTRDPDSKELQDVIDLFLRWSFESTTLFLLSKRMGCLDEHIPPDTMELLYSVDRFMQSTIEIQFSLPVHKFWESKAIKRNIEAQKNIRRIAMKYIKARVSKIDAQDEQSHKEAPEKEDFLTFLMNSGKLNLDQVNGIVIDMLTAGLDTTALTLVWCLYLLATNAEKQEKLRSEVTSVLGSERMVTPTHINEMQYLRYCVKETTRMYPINGFNVRTTKTELVLSGYKVPAGKGIVMPLMVMGRLPQNFSEPDQFLPERWNKDKEDAPNLFASLPFGFGPRMCAGRRIAELSLHIALAQLMRRYRVEYLEETPMDYIQKPIISPDKKLNLVFTDIH